MRRFVLALMLFGVALTCADAQDAIPDLKGTWTGKGNAIVFGNNAHHPGAQTANDPPRVHEIEAKYVVDGQDGRLVWGRSSSSIADTEEPFGWAIASGHMDRDFWLPPVRSAFMPRRGGLSIDGPRL